MITYARRLQPLASGGKVFSIMVSRCVPLCVFQTLGPGMDVSVWFMYLDRRSNAAKTNLSWLPTPGGCNLRQEARSFYRFGCQCVVNVLRPPLNRWKPIRTHARRLQPDVQEARCFLRFFQVPPDVCFMILIPGVFLCVYFRPLGIEWMPVCGSCT